MPVLLGDPERVLADHEVPTHRRVASDVRPTISQFQGGQGRTPSLALDLKVAERFTGFAEEDVVVMDDASGCESGTQSELPLENR